MEHCQINPILLQIFRMQVKSQFHIKISKQQNFKGGKCSKNSDFYQKIFKNHNLFIRNQS